MRSVGRLLVALVLGSGGGVVLAAPAPASQPSAYASFEAAAAAATPVNDLASWLAPLAARCTGDDDLARRQCLGLRAATTRDAAGRTFLVAGDAKAIQLGAYAAKDGGIPVTLGPCIACSPGVALGDDAIAVVKAKTGPGGDVAHAVVAAKDEAAAKAWRKAAGGYLEPVYVIRLLTQPLADGQTFEAEVVAQRIYDRCSGQVIESSPPTAAPVDTRAESQDCPVVAPPVAAEKPAGPRLPPALTPDDVQAGLSSARADVSACFDRYHVSGQIRVAASIAGSDGKVIGIKVLGDFAGTPTGSCVAQAVMKVPFPHFAAEVQTVTLPFFLR